MNLSFSDSSERRGASYGPSRRCQGAIGERTRRVDDSGGGTVRRDMQSFAKRFDKARVSAYTVIEGVHVQGTEEPRYLAV